MKRKLLPTLLAAAALLLPQAAPPALAHAAPAARAQTHCASAQAERPLPVRLAWDRVGAVA